jgi:cell division protein FtsI (penicillin-binding protein 3)
MEEQENKLSWRLGCVYVLVIVLAVVLVGKILYIQVWDGEKWKQKARAETVQAFEVMPDRGNICAEDGRILAASIPYFSLRFDPLVAPDTLFKRQVDSLALMLSRFFKDASPRVYRDKLWNARYGARPNRYLSLARRRVNYAELKEIKRFPLLNRGSRGGLIVEQTEERDNPYRPLAGRTIGYLSMGSDSVYRAKVGLEEAYDEDLKGIPGISKNQMVSGGWVPFPIEDPVHGHDVITTIDIDYQDIVHGALKRQLEHFRADAGVAILMEVKTGDIKAIANLTRKEGGAYTEVLNNAIWDAAEPGSVFKAAVMIALLEDGHVHPDDTVDLGAGRYVFFNRDTLHESTRGYVGKVTVQQIFERSLNGISTLVHDNYRKQPDRLSDRLHAMQLGEKLGVEIKGEGIPLIKYPKDAGWSPLTLSRMSIGYEVKLTPLQVLAFYNALANDGKRMKPRFVKEIRNGNEVVRRVPAEVVDRSICSKETLAHMRKMMEGVVENGTARNLRGTVYGIAGKTGTARIADESKGYNMKKYRASFVGYFPANDPLYSCIVVVENPSQLIGYYGNVVSGNVFRDISDKVYALASLKHGRPREEEGTRLPASKNGYKPDLLTLYDALDIRVNEEGAGKSDWVLTSRVEDRVVLRPRSVDFSVVPNAKGMGLRDALYVLENSGLKVGVSGAGMVMQQSIEPGKKVARGSYIHVELR